QQDPVIGRARIGPHAGLRDDGPAATGGEPLPHSRRWAGVLRLADLRTGGAGLRALGLTLALRFLLRALLVRLASSLEAVVASAAHRTPMTTSYYSRTDRKSTRLNSSHDQISYAVFCLKKKKT